MHKRTFPHLKETARFFGNDGLWWWRSSGEAGSFGAEDEEGTEQEHQRVFGIYLGRILGPMCISEPGWV